MSNDDPDFDLCEAIARELERDPGADPADVAKRVVSAIPDDALRPTLEALLPRRVTLEMCEIDARRVAAGDGLAA